MNSQDALKWNELILAAIDGTISPADFARLDTGIRTDSELANHYVGFMLLYAGLRQPGQVSTFFTESGVKSDSGLNMDLWNELAMFEKTAETVEIAAPSRIAEPLPAEPASIGRIERRISRLPIYTSILSIAALVLMGLFVYLNPRTTDSVGILVKTVDAKWLGTTETLEAGQDLRKGLLHLDRGLARICFDSGASVILQGPVQVELLSGNSMALRQGKIVATVKRDAIGFVVDTPQGKILDLGTEFGIQVEPTGRSQVHVFQGEVVLYPTNDESRLNVSQGSAKSVDQNGRVADIPLQTAAFVRQDEMGSKLLAQTGNSYHRWKAWVFEIHRDPSLAAHYFDIKDESQPENLLNTAAMANGPAGHFGDQGRTAPQWVQGRWPEKPAVRFQR
jgi:hypothetical protein